MIQEYLIDQRNFVACIVLSAVTAFVHPVYAMIWLAAGFVILEMQRLGNAQDAAREQVLSGVIKKNEQTLVRIARALEAQRD